MGVGVAKNCLFLPTPDFWPKNAGFFGFEAKSLVLSLFRLKRHVAKQFCDIPKPFCDIAKSDGNITKLLRDIANLTGEIAKSFRDVTKLRRDIAGLSGDVTNLSAISQNGLVTLPNRSATSQPGLD